MEKSRNNNLKRNKNATLRKTSDRYDGVNKNKNFTLRKSRHAVSGGSCFDADGKTDTVVNETGGVLNDITYCSLSNLLNSNQQFNVIPQRDGCGEVDQSHLSTCTTSMSDNDVAKGKHSDCWDLFSIPQTLPDELKQNKCESRMEACAQGSALDEHLTKERRVKIIREMCDKKNTCSNKNEMNLPNVRYGPASQNYNCWEGPVKVFYRDDFRTLKYDCFYESPLFCR